MLNSKNILNILYTLLGITMIFPYSVLAQKKFKIEIDAPAFYNDSLIFAAPMLKVGLEDVYNFNLDSNSNISYFSKMVGKKASVFQLKMKENFFLEGNISYPQPVTFQYFDKFSKQIYISSIFFIDSGYHKIFLPKMFNLYEVNINSPLNIEYKNFKKIFADLYFTKSDNTETIFFNNLEIKGKRIGDYIKNNSNSYVALWEIINDYTLYGYNSTFLKNLELFSNIIKRTYVYNQVVSRLKGDSASIKGSEFPKVLLDKSLKLDKELFKRYNYTFIDFWSITCTPCIKAMPEILKMYKQYKKNGVNFISVTAESEFEKQKIAKKILGKYQIVWSNYFDINNEFSSKLGVSAYPLYLLVDHNGFIVEKSYGDFTAIKAKISVSN